jgi:hypothetical protein
MRGNWIAAAILIGVAGAEARAQPAFVQVGEIAGPVDVVRAEGAMVYASAGRTLTVYDVADPSAPRQRGSYTFPQEIWSFRVAGSVVYAGVNFYGLGVLDVSDPATPALRSAFKTRGQAKTGAVFGTRAIVVDHMEGLVLVDLSTPAVPTSPGAFFVDGYARDVTTVGRHAFAVDSPTGFYVLDLSKADPLEPVASVQSGAALRALEVEGSLAVLVGGGALHPFDVTNPAAPVKHPPFRTPGGALHVALQGRRALVADQRAGLQVVDLSSPAAPVVVGTFKTGGVARHVAASGDLVFVVVAKEGAKPQDGGRIVILKERR